MAACGGNSAGDGGGGGDVVNDALCASRVNDTEAKLVECIRKDPLWAHMVAFQQIADEHPGPDGHPSRNAGEPGYLASVNYVADKLRAAGYQVTIQPYTLAYHGFVGDPVMEVVSPSAHRYTLGSDFMVPVNSGSREVTAPLDPVGNILVPAPASPASTSGCTSADFSGFMAGHVALIQRGTCSYAQKVANAVAAGAGGVILFNGGVAGQTAAATCGGLGSPSVPVVCLASYAVGASLYQQAQAQATTVHLKIAAIVDPARADYNLIADSPNGDPDHIVVVDAHLDAIYGAGMLDNASGSATILEIALKLAKTHTRQRLRFIWFGGEELGLLGSFYYTRNLSPADAGKIVFDVDADVTATPNYVHAIADPANSPGAKNFSPGVVAASELGNQYFVKYFTAAGLPYERRSNDGTDSYAFSFIGVPNTGVLTGQDCCKPQSDVDLFGGTVGNYEGNRPGSDGGFVDRPFLWGDNLDNNDPQVLETVSKAVASVVFNLANDASLSPTSSRIAAARRPELPASRIRSGLGVDR
jgi:hypothetical protein